MAAATTKVLARPAACDVKLAILPNSESIAGLSPLRAPIKSPYAQARCSGEPASRPASTRLALRHGAFGFGDLRAHQAIADMQRRQRQPELSGHGPYRARGSPEMRRQPHRCRAA